MKIEKIIFLVNFLIFLVPSGAFADSRDNFQIHVCISKNGTVRVLSPNSKCKSDEIPQHWHNEAHNMSMQERMTLNEKKDIAQDAAIAALQNKNAQQDTWIATLQGQGGGGIGTGSFVVKDNAGQLVGKIFGSYPMRQVGKDPLILPTAINGFFTGNIGFFYTTNNCSGTRYLSSDRDYGSLAENVITSDGKTGYFASFPGQPQIIQSQDSFSAGDNASGTGTCFQLPPQTYIVAPAFMINLTGFGFTPPFHLE